MLGDHRALTVHGQGVYNTSVSECGGVLPHTAGLYRPCHDHEIILDDGEDETSVIDGNHRCSVNRKSYPSLIVIFILQF